MWSAWVLTGLLTLQTAATVRTGMITGAIVAPPQQEISHPVQVLLLSSQYTDVWNNDLQQRLDAYWEIYKPSFAARRDFFLVASRQAHLEATNYVLMRMRSDFASSLSDYLKETAADGRFEFRNIPFGEYQILATGKLGEQNVIWQEFVNVRDAIPQFLQLNQRLP